MRPRKVAQQASGGRQAGRQTGSGTPWQEITYLHGALWSGGRGRARQGGVADIAAKVTQSNRGSAKSEREKVAPLGPWAISHFNPLQEGGQAGSGRDRSRGRNTGSRWVRVGA